MNYKIPNLKQILKPSWEHTAGKGIINGELKKQKKLEQATTPYDKDLLNKLKIKKQDRILAIAGYYGNWASALNSKVSRVDYSDVSKSLVEWVKKNVKPSFGKYILSNYELIPKKEMFYDWTFSFEPCGAKQGLPIACLRFLLNNKGGILMYYIRKEEESGKGGKEESFPLIFKTLTKIYRTEYNKKEINIRAKRKKGKLGSLPHMVFWIETNHKAREKAKTDLKVLDFLNSKRKIDLDKDPEKLELDKKELKSSLSRLSKLSKIIKEDFVKEVEVK